MTDLSLSLSPSPSAGGVARAAIRKWRGAELGCAAIADLELVISELVTNSVTHGHGTIRVELRHSHGEGDLNGSVSDAGDGFAYKRRNVPNYGSHGRGLVIVDAIVADWGIRRGSTTVWFVMPVSSS